jgi:protein-S-isoprenylcysteine O-methyltransferase Ste14
MASWLVRLGDFSFRYRGYLLPVAVILYLLPGPPLFPDPARAGLDGFLIAAFGQLIRILTVGLAYIIRGGKDHRVYAEDLVTSGLYSHCRNPMYVGNFFLLIGLAVAANSWVFALGGILLGLGMHRAIVAAEEHFLRGKFGAAYDAYCADVPRWVPRLGGLLATVSSMQFQWRRVILKEYATSFDWLSATALVVLVNLWRTGTLAGHPWLTGVLITVILMRIALSFLSRRMQRLQA